LSTPKLSARPALLFDLDGTLVDSVYQHVLSWRDALESEGLHLSVWRIHRRIGMSGGLFLKALDRELGTSLSDAQAERLRQTHELRVRKTLAEAQSVAEKLSATSVRVKARAGEDGRLFGSITVNDLAKELQARAGTALDRRQIHLAEPIRSVGTHEVTVHLRPEVNANVTVEVVAE